MCRYIKELIERGVLHIPTYGGLIVFFEHGGRYIVYYRGPFGALAMILNDECKPNLVGFTRMDKDEALKRVGEALGHIREVYERLKKREDGG